MSSTQATRRWNRPLALGPFGFQPAPQPFFDSDIPLYNFSITNFEEHSNQLERYIQQKLVLLLRVVKE
ncbi:MAG TPA: hypothetical protein ACFCUD_00600 [Cyclobacteriaceae bacterium]